MPNCMKGFLLVAVAVALAGCVMPTKQPPEGQIVPVPNERLHLFQEAAPGSGKVLVTRDVGMIGSGCYLGLLIDGQLAAKLDAGERATFNLPTGEHLLTVTWVKGRGLCGAFYSDESAAARRRSAEVIVREGATKSYRIHTNTDGESTVEPVL